MSEGQGTEQGRGFEPTVGTGSWGRRLDGEILKVRTAQTPFMAQPDMPNLRGFEFLAVPLKDGHGIGIRRHHIPGGDDGILPDHLAGTTGTARAEHPREVFGK